MRRQRSHAILRAFFGEIWDLYVGLNALKTCCAAWFKEKNPETSPSKPRFGGSMFDFRRFLLETFVSVGRPWIWKCWDFPSLQEWWHRLPKNPSKSSFFSLCCWLNDFQYSERCWSNLSYWFFLLLVGCQNIPKISQSVWNMLKLQTQVCPEISGHPQHSQKKRISSYLFQDFWRWSAGQLQIDFRQLLVLLFVKISYRLRMPKGLPHQIEEELFKQRVWKAF